MGNYINCLLYTLQTVDWHTDITCRRDYLYSDEFLEIADTFVHYRIEMKFPCPGSQAEGFCVHAHRHTHTLSP